MKDMKIAVVTFREGGTEQDMCGIVTAPLYIADMLSPYVKSADVFSARSKVPLSVPKVWGERVKTADSSAVLNEYDYVIFTTPGKYYTTTQFNRDKERNPDKVYNYPTILDGLKTRFSILNADEQDINIYSYMNTFLSHEACDGVIFLSEEMRDSTLIDTNDKNVYILPPTPKLTNRDYVIGRAKSPEKTRSIISLARWINCKRIAEYLQLVKDRKFQENNISAEIAGTCVSTFYAAMTMYPMGLTDKFGNINEDIPVLAHGSYDPTDLERLLKHISFSWDFLYYERVTAKSLKPRLMQTSIEALCQGVLPVVCEEFTPKWLGSNSLIRLPKKDMNEIPYVVGQMSDEERINRVADAYDILDTVQSKYYKDFVEVL